MRAMSRRFHVPIFIGDFSCINWAPKNDKGSGAQQNGLMIISPYLKQKDGAGSTIRGENGHRGKVKYHHNGTLITV